MTDSLKNSSKSLHLNLQEYIESRYHIVDENLLKQRENLLNDKFDNPIYKGPFIETTNKYEVFERGFFGINELEDEVKKLFISLTTKSENLEQKLFTPYLHQVEAITEFLNHKNLIITTGTGSGKTESFLLPILSYFANLAIKSPENLNNDSLRCILLYPMNALVNDQLGRLRNLFNDTRISNFFKSKIQRPLTFGKYTGRTLYPGVRNSEKDGKKLKPLKMYKLIENIKNDKSHEDNQEFTKYFNELNSLSKWPAKQSMSKWYGAGEWKDRAKKLDGDIELITRHEIIDSPPDFLVTNYSMLNYMLLRPLERSIFDKTKQWLKKDENQLIIVVDEAHLYNGSSGTEVSILLDRLYARLGINSDKVRFIATSASIEDNSIKDYAKSFIAEFSGKKKDDYCLIKGKLKNNEVFKHNFLKEDYEIFKTYDGNENIVDYFKKKKNLIDLNNQQFADFLSNYEPIVKIKTFSMGKAKKYQEIIDYVFDNNKFIDDKVDVVITNILKLGVGFKINNQSLIPLRVHSFFSGLAGLWICLNKECYEFKDIEKKNSTIFSQPKNFCNRCGSKVFEYYTCRYCGSSYARGYIKNDDINDDNEIKRGTFIFSEQGYSANVPIDFYIDDIKKINLEESPLKLFKISKNIGKINDEKSSAHIDALYMLNNEKFDEDEDEKNSQDNENLLMNKCFVCNNISQKIYDVPVVQNHQTRGSQPFHSIVLNQLNNQEVDKDIGKDIDEFNPLNGRKLLVFSDSRKIAANLVNEIKKYSLSDILRPLFLWGYKFLKENKYKKLSMFDAFIACQIAAKKFKILLRTKGMSDEDINHMIMCEKTILDILSKAEKNEIDDDFFELIDDLRDESKNFQEIYEELCNSIIGQYGIENLGFAFFKETDKYSKKLLENLDDIGGLLKNNEEKIYLIRAIIRKFINNSKKIPFSSSKDDSDAFEYEEIKKPSIKNYLKKILKNIFRETQKFKTEQWDEIIKDNFLNIYKTNSWRFNSKSIDVEFADEWQRCNKCSSVHQIFKINNRHWCMDCQSSNVSIFDVKKNDIKNQAFFKFKKRYENFRKKVSRVFENGISDKVVEVGEHTANLSSVRTENSLFSLAEINELLFQDINLKDLMKAVDDKDSQKFERAIDILSCTTTMEVGIDIGKLSAVAMRNMPPSRANYQQRAGRAGRRANNIASVISYGNQNSHDQNYFKKPLQMISDPVKPPKLSKRNSEILFRHIFALMVQQYAVEKLSSDNALNNENNDLFLVFGTIENFNNKDSILNIFDFDRWVNKNKANLVEITFKWGRDDTKISENTIVEIFEDFKIKFEKKINELKKSNIKEKKKDKSSENETSENDESDDEERNRKGNSNKLLDFLMFEGLFPQYGFPTDVVDFHVFSDDSDYFRPEFDYTSSRSIKHALSEFAPGNRIAIDGKVFTSKLLYSRDKNALFNATSKKKYYFECKQCFSVTLTDSKNLESLKCDGCGSKIEHSFPWISPPGFAHFFKEPSIKENSFNPVPLTYTTKPKLMIKSEKDMKIISNNLFFKSIENLATITSTNNGPKNKGYKCCFKCGLISPQHIEDLSEKDSKIKSVFGVDGKSHYVGFPSEKAEKECNGFVATGVRLGTEYKTNVLLISFKNLKIVNGNSFLYSEIGQSIMTTLSYAMSLHITRDLLELNSFEIDGYFRPAFNESGHKGIEVEIYLFDTLPGGAGYVSRYANEEDFRDLLIGVKNLLDDCDCDSSCYKCLRNFTNKNTHHLFNRIYASTFLKKMINDDRKQIHFYLDNKKLKKSSIILCNFLSEYFKDYNFQSSFNIGGIEHHSVKFTSKDNREGYVIICHPLSFESEVPADQSLIDPINEGKIDNYILVNDFDISKDVASIISKFEDEFVKI